MFARSRSVDQIQSSDFIVSEDEDGIPKGVDIKHPHAIQSEELTVLPVVELRPL